MLDSVIVGITKVRWVSAAGVLTGTVKSIDIAKNAAGEFIEWINIETDRGVSRLALTPSNIAMLKMEAV